MEVLLQAGVIAGLPYLKQLTAAGKRSRQEAISLAERMVDAWDGDAQRWNAHSLGAGRPESPHRTEMIATLRKLGAAALLERFIADIVTPAYDGLENTALVSSVSVWVTRRPRRFFPPWCWRGCQTAPTNVRRFCLL
jgi:hypothetical protein